MVGSWLLQSIGGRAGTQNGYCGALVGGLVPGVAVGPPAVAEACWWVGLSTLLTVRPCLCTGMGGALNGA